jgi:hypothetical protein
MRRRKHHLVAADVARQARPVPGACTLAGPPKQGILALCSLLGTLCVFASWRAGNLTAADSCPPDIEKGSRMKKTALIVAALSLGAMVSTAPAEARGFRGFGGAGIGLGIAAGALAAGAYGAYGPGYGYGYGPGYYAPRYAYGPGYGYYGRGYYRGGPRYYGYY